MFVHLFDFIIFFLLQQRIDETGVVAYVVMQYFQILFRLFYEIMPVFQPLNIGFLHHIFPVDSIFAGFALQITQHNNIGDKHGYDSKQDPRNVVGIIEESIGEKCDKGKAAVKKYRDQAQLPIIFPGIFSLDFQKQLPDEDTQKQQNGEVYGKTAGQGEESASRVYFQNCGNDGAGYDIAGGGKADEEDLAAFFPGDKKRCRLREQDLKNGNDDVTKITVGKEDQFDKI